MSGDKLNRRDESLLEHHHITPQSLGLAHDYLLFVKDKGTQNTIEVADLDHPDVKYRLELSPSGDLNIRIGKNSLLLKEQPYSHTLQLTSDSLKIITEFILQREKAKGQYHHRENAMPTPAMAPESPETISNNFENALAGELPKYEVDFVKGRILRLKLRMGEKANKKINWVDLARQGNLNIVNAHKYEMIIHCAYDWLEMIFSRAGMKQMFLQLKSQIPPLHPSFKTAPKAALIMRFDYSDDDRIDISF